MDINPDLNNSKKEEEMQEKEEQNTKKEENKLEIIEEKKELTSEENREEKKEGTMEEIKEEKKDKITEEDKEEIAIEIKEEKQNQQQEQNEQITDNNKISNEEKKNQEEQIISKEEINIDKDNNKIILKETSQENINLKPQKEKSEFELHIVQAYKKLTGQISLDSGNSQTNENISEKPNEKELISNSENILNVKNCEKEIRLALNSCIQTKIISLNKNILDKMGRIIRHNKMNLIFIIGQIYINLMSKDYLFNPLNKDINLNLLIFFCNEVISLNSLLKQTYLGNKYNQVLINFIIRIMSEYTLEKEQLSVMTEILQRHNINQKPIKINANNFEDIVKFINDTLNEQESFYEQYKFIFDNSDYIGNAINNINIYNQEELKYLTHFLDLGKIFSYLLFNKKFVIYLKQQSQDNEVQGISKKMFNGYEDNININAIEDEKFYIDIDEDIELMRENLCKLIIIYVEQFKAIKNLLEFQYVLYVLIKRIYFHFYEKFKEQIDVLLAEIMTNLCFFKEETIEEIKIFINEILKSDKEEDANLKKLIQEKIEQNKSNPEFNFKNQENENNNKEDKPEAETEDKNEENYFTNITNISIETIYLSQNDLRIGFFNKKVIKAGEIFTFYIELSKPYGILDFCMALDDYDIKLRIKNLTEGREVYNESEVTIFHCPLKLTMFFTKPGIFQFEFDNSYSWLRSKTVRYKINKFYPQKAYYLERKIILMKYKEIIYNRKTMSTINYNNYPTEIGIGDIPQKKIFLVKFNGENNSFNCSDTTLNIEISNKMVRDNYLKISSIYIDIGKTEEKSYFYVQANNENNGLIKYELNKDNFMKYINEEIINKSKVNIDIINLYIITNNLNIIDNHYISIEEILGFEPDINSDELNNNHCKILFFLQYLHQAQMLYYLFNKISNNEKIETVILISYNTFSGYQICLYKNCEIFLKIKNWEIKKEESLKENMSLIAEKIKEFGKEEKIEILIGENINLEDKEINAEKIGDELIKKLGMNLEEEGNLKVIYLNKDFNKEVSLNSHIFYLDE